MMAAMPDVMAIVSKAVFKKVKKAGKGLGLGDVFGTAEYVSKNKGLQRLKDGGSLFLVTARPGDVLWLVAVLEAPTFAKDRWQAVANARPIVEITALKSQLKFDSGKGITAKPGALGMSLQTPRALTAGDVKLLRGAWGIEQAPSSAPQESTKNPAANKPKKKAAKKKAAKKVANKAKASKTKASSPSQLIDRLLRVWADTRHPEIADLLDRSSPHAESPAVAPLREAVRGTNNVPQKTWMKLESGHDAVDRQALLASLFHGTIKETKERMKRIAAWPADPRTAARFVRSLETIPRTSYATKPIYNGMIRALPKLGDVRAIERIGAIDPGTYPAMVDWFEERIPPLAEKLKALTSKAVEPATLETLREQVDALAGVAEPESAPAALHGIPDLPTDAPRFEHTRAWPLFDGQCQWSEHATASGRTLFTYAEVDARRSNRDETREFVLVDDEEQVLLAGSHRGPLRLSASGRWLGGLHDASEEWQRAIVQLRVWDVESGAMVLNEELSDSRSCGCAVQFVDGTLYWAITPGKESRVGCVRNGVSTTLVRKDADNAVVPKIRHSAGHVCVAFQKDVWVIDHARGALVQAMQLGWVHDLAPLDAGRFALATFSGGSITPPDPTRRAMFASVFDASSARGLWEIQTPTKSRNSNDAAPQLFGSAEKLIRIDGPRYDGSLDVDEVVEGEFRSAVSTRKMDTKTIGGAFIVHGSPADGTHTAFLGGEDGWARWQSLPDFETIAERRGYLPAVGAVATSADGSVLVACRGRRANIWHGEKHKRITVQSESGISALAIGDEGVVAIARGHSVQLHAPTGKKLGVLKGKTNIQDVCWNSKTNSFCTVTLNGINVYAADQSFERTVGERHGLSSGDVRVDGDLFVGADGQVLLCWSRTGKQLAETKFDGLVRKVRFAPDGSVWVWEGMRVVQLDAPTLVVLTETEYDEVTGLAVSPKGWLAIGTARGIVEVRAGAAGPAAVLEGHGQPVSAMALGTSHLVVGHTRPGVSGTVNVYAL